MCMRTLKNCMHILICKVFPQTHYVQVHKHSYGATLHFIYIYDIYIYIYMIYIYMYHTCIIYIIILHRKQITLHISSKYPRTSGFLLIQPMAVAFFDLSQVPRLFGIHQQPIKGRRQAPTAAVALIIQDLDGLGSCRKLWCLWDHLGHLINGRSPGS